MSRFKISELKRVIVASESRIVMNEALEVALARIFAGEAPQLARAAAPPALIISDGDAEVVERTML